VELMSELAIVSDELVISHEFVEVPQTSRQRLQFGAGLLLAGLLIFFGFGLGANNGESAFKVSQVGYRFHIPNLQFPGGAFAMVLGVIVVVLAVGQFVRGYHQRGRKIATGITVACFVLGFVIWAGTGDPKNEPLSLSALVGLSIIAAIPLILGSLSGIICERSGVINVSIEGQMLTGAFAGPLFGSTSHNLAVGLLAAVLAGGLIGLLLAVFAIKYHVNQVVVGVVLNTFALGLTNLGFQSLMNTNSNSYNSGATLGSIKIPLLSDIPIIGQDLFNTNVIVYAAYVLLIVVEIALFRTRWGLRTRAVGEHPKAADTVGIKVLRIRYWNVFIGGLIGGLAGAALTIGGSGQFNENISSGKGFIALAAVIFGRWRPRGALVAALLFGFCDELQVLLSAVPTPVTIPSGFLSMLPYVVTIVVVAGFVGQAQAPAADGQPYQKG
jgi:simple sugar transport system permease protein